MKKKNDFAVMGLWYSGHDTSASIMINGKLIAACEQERYTRDKHSYKFPKNAIDDCLIISGLKLEDIDKIAFPFLPNLHVREMYLRPALEDDNKLSLLINSFDSIRERFNVTETIRTTLGFEGIIESYRHHLCHLASAYYPSGFSDAVLVSYDGIGEFESGVIGIGKNGDINIVNEDNRHPNSLGLFYAAITVYLGWKYAYDEGIIMGLAPFGNPNAIVSGTGRTYLDFFRDMIVETSDFSYSIDTSWIAFHEVRNKWVSDKFVSVFGPRRNSTDPLSDIHKNIAAALQTRLEEVVISQLRKAREKYKLSKLGLAGGVALNCSLNGKIAASNLFDEIFIPPASGDAGVPIGACYLSTHNNLNNFKAIKNHNFYSGSRFKDDEIALALNEHGLKYEKPSNIFDVVATHLNNGKIVGWFQGASEFGPRALGNRSILTRPYPSEMKDYLNERVKFREDFRPFAPSVISEDANDYFHITNESPHMLIAMKVKEEMHHKIPAVVHVDKTCRVQMVHKDINYKFYKLLEAFKRATGISVLLNTSFNVKGQPIVNTPIEAIECFIGTNIDILCIGDYVVNKEYSGPHK